MRTAKILRNVNLTKLTPQTQEAVMASSREVKSQQRVCFEGYITQLNSRKKEELIFEIKGVIHSGSNLSHCTTPSGTVESVPGFSPAFKAKVTFGADWLQFDPSGETARIEYRGIAKTKDGSAIDFRYNGVITTTPDVMKIFGMQPDRKTVPFGFSTGTNTFTVADPKLKVLEDSCFCSNGRIICHEDGLTVEVRVSKVIPDDVMDVPEDYNEINQ